MTYLNRPVGQIENAYSSAQAPLPMPPAGTTRHIVKRTCAAVQSDTLYSCNARTNLTLVVENDSASAGALTLTPASSETINGAATLVLQPGDSYELANPPGTGTNWVIL